MIYIYLAIGGFTGAISRYLVLEVINNRKTSMFPWATLAVNVMGSFGLGFVVGQVGLERVVVDQSVLLTGGFLASFTTFSTFSYELVSFWSRREIKLLVQYILLTILGSGLLYSIGFFLGKL